MDNMEIYVWVLRLTVYFNDEVSNKYKKSFISVHPLGDDFYAYSFPIPVTLTGEDLQLIRLSTLFNCEFDNIDDYVKHFITAAFDTIKDEVLCTPISYRTEHTDNLLLKRLLLMTNTFTSKLVDSMFDLFKFFMNLDRLSRQVREEHGEFYYYTLNIYRTLQ